MEKAREIVFYLFIFRDLFCFSVTLFRELRMLFGPAMLPKNNVYEKNKSGGESMKITNHPTRLVMIMLLMLFAGIAHAQGPNFAVTPENYDDMVKS